MDTLPIDFSYKILYSKYQAPELRAFNNWLNCSIVRLYYSINWETFGSTSG